MNDSNSPLDMEKLNAAFMNNLDIIKQILTAFKESFVSFEEEFIEAQYQSDNEMMSRLAHGLKGSAGNIRAEKLSEQAADLQYCIDRGDPVGSRVDDTIAGLKALLTQIDEIITS